MSRVAVAFLALALCGCGGASATPRPDEPQRYADYDGITAPDVDQCDLPVEQRTGGWVCHETK